jgi:dTDP-glucose 4,6-dehydratase
VYNIGPEGESKTNFEVATAVARAAGLGEAKVYLTAYDRPQHDRRYAIDSSKLRSLGWSPSVSFDTAVRLTVEWYETNRSWWSPLLTDAEQIYSDAERAIRR